MESVTPLGRWRLPQQSTYRPSLRERLTVRIARLRRWEFWPVWAFYPPIIAYILWLGLRHRSPLAFTAANPGLEGGGFVGERKADCLLPLQANAPELVAPLQLLRADLSLGERLTQAQHFVAHEGGYPVVLKPNIGQRGRGVAIVRDAAALGEYLSGAPGDVIIQRYIEGAEFGVFVYRDPSTQAPRIYSVTHKCFPRVVGDGTRPLHRLIRDDARARLISPLLWRRFGDAIERVPAAGEDVSLVEIGAHCRGSLFLDASELASEALHRRVAQLFEALPGFHFGRLDLRCPSAEALVRGEGIRILEVNGVGAEAAHIYHPDTPLWRGYASMLRQWQLAFAVGVRNMRMGARPLTIREFFQRVFEDGRRDEQWF
jgi:hypothetical protein